MVLKVSSRPVSLPSSMSQAGGSEIYAWGTAQPTFGGASTFAAGVLLPLMVSHPSILFFVPDEPTDSGDVVFSC